MPPKVFGSFFFFGTGGSFASEEKRVDGYVNCLKNEFVPSLKLQTDKEFYRPGDSVDVIVEIHNPGSATETSETENGADDICSFLVERLTFEIKGIEKLDTQWFSTQKPLPGLKQKRGEQVFLDCAIPSIVSNKIISSRGTKIYIVRTVLPVIIPPTYRGTTIRYHYYVRCTLSGRWLVLENVHSRREPAKDLIQLEARSPLPIWVTQKTSGLLTEESQSDGILPSSTTQMDIYWKEKDADSEWVRANEPSDVVEEGYESSRDEVSSISSYNPTKGNIDLAFRSSLSLQSSAARSSNKGASYLQGERSSLSSYMALPQLSVAVSYDSTGDVPSTEKKSPAVLSPSQQRKYTNPFSADDDTGVPSVPGTIEPVASEGFIRGRSYNIRLDDQVLLRFSPKNSDSTYYFGDMIGGTLTFFHEGARTCLEVSITLETSETIGQRFVHPSRRNSPTITKVQSDHHEVVADLVQTSFLFSIPTDGPMSFSTPHISVQWALRFEFFTNPKNVDWTRELLPGVSSNQDVNTPSQWIDHALNLYDHPLLIEGRDKGEWILPIKVHAPPPRTQAGQTRNEKSSSLGPFWVRD